MASAYGGAHSVSGSPVVVAQTSIHVGSGGRVMAIGTSVVTGANSAAVCQLFLGTTPGRTIGYAGVGGNVRYASLTTSASWFDLSTGTYDVKFQCHEATGTTVSVSQNYVMAWGG